MTVANMLDVLRRLDPNGQPAAVAEILTKKNPILQDMPYQEGNLPTGHKSTIRTGFPSVVWRRYNMGVPPAKSATTQVVDSCGMLEARCEVDQKLAELNGGSASFFMTESAGALEAMAREHARVMFYGTEANPEQIIGLTPRYSTPSTDWSKSGYNMISGGCSSEATGIVSVWLVRFSPNGIFGIYPKGSSAGMKVAGPVACDVVDSGGTDKYDGWRMTYKMDTGLVVRNWRDAVRICNVDESDLIGNTGTMASSKIIELMIRASERLDSRDGAVFYVPRVVSMALRLAILAKIANNLSFENVAGQQVMMFDDIPVKVCDALVNTESYVSGTFAAI